MFVLFVLFVITSRRTVCLEPALTADADASITAGGQHGRGGLTYGLA